MSVTLVRQSGPTTCGQSCLAMLLGLTLAEAVELVGHDGITTDAELWDVLGTEAAFTQGTPPPHCVALQKHREPDGEREHWTVSVRGKTLDPAMIGRRLWPVSKHLVIDWL